MNDGEPEELLERIEISVAMNHRVLLSNAEGRNQAIDRLANGVAASSKRPVVARGLTRQISAARVEELQLEQRTLDSLSRDVITYALGIPRFACGCSADTSGGPWLSYGDGSPFPTLMERERFSGLTDEDSRVVDELMEAAGSTDLGDSVAFTLAAHNLGELTIRDLLAE